jgi:hypothetical protein
MGVTPYSNPSRGRRLRLTRRGRVVVMGFCLAVISAAVAWLAPASRAADPPGAPPSAVVRPGDTLWSVAERHRPSGDAVAVIGEIKRLNGLDNAIVHPGQRLTLPMAR